MRAEVYGTTDHKAALFRGMAFASTIVTILVCLWPGTLHIDWLRQVSNRAHEIAAATAQVETAWLPSALPVPTVRGDLR